MSESIATQVKEAPGKFLSAPIMAMVIGLIFLVAVLIAEAYKPGLITGPIRRGLSAIGVKSA
jgi:hypothetical protein